MGDGGLGAKGELNDLDGRNWTRPHPCYVIMREPFRTSDLPKGRTLFTACSRSLLFGLLLMETVNEP